MTFRIVQIVTKLIPMKTIMKMHKPTKNKDRDILESLMYADDNTNNVHDKKTCMFRSKN